MPENSPGECNLLWAFALIDGLASSGVTQAVVSPGSRSTPLVLACDSHPAIEVTPMVDERCAAFFALGLAKQNHRPVILIATSGSAPAHWFPAVIEACHSNIPLLLLTADRPPELHGWGANQTTDQQNLFGSHLRAFHDPGPAQDNTPARAQLLQLGSDAAMHAVSPWPGPIQINMPFREPLLPPVPAKMPSPIERQRRKTQNGIADPDSVEAIVREIAGRPGLILCGASDLGKPFAQAVTHLAERLNCPIIADPLSNLRFGKHDKSTVISHYDAFIETAAKRLKPSWILRFGALPVSKPLLQYLDKTAAPQLICDPYQQWPKMPPNGQLSISAEPTSLCEAIETRQPEPAPAEWLNSIRQMEQAAADLMQPSTDGDRPFEGSLIKSLFDCLPNESLLFSGNSMPIRQLDSWSAKGDKAIHIAANRGVSGIDGNISTFIGMSGGGYRASVALLGDLAFYHDMNGLLAARGKDLVIVLINNNGGGIFGYLPQATLSSYERYWNTATELDFKQTAALYGLNYQRITRQSAFQPALKQAFNAKGPQLIEVMVERDYSIKRHRHYRGIVARQITRQNG
ncbi:MAG: 2-succinyl-5-enolpyruvyl-6-hydroxy-3-cyclohexene-1-carboxylic-acid synthase [Sedimenticola thiotaurini]|uniref:2-succinyl-5-enolpyruvyl-6-hydroxy-3-cyclohexene-1-carboxylate synthase n=1 Tax=Sedimenticola thiotaurini TaxID=1543721 RepID=A0A558DAE3_9GAMM|nr:MAG: 2-succinyl-5-enolpyruvyl-6-hydroxy-3-cyclohexene-1-carboxylic-acid synthase [Sedimenticola thiotaurini]